MQDIVYFLWLAGQAFLNPLVGIPSSIVFVLTTVAWFVSPRERRLRWGDALALQTPSLFTLLILLCGTLFERDRILPSEITEHFLTGLLALQALLILWLIWRLRGYRTIAVLQGGIQFWCTLVAAFVSGMSVTGRWL